MTSRSDPHTSAPAGFKRLKAGGPYFVQLGPTFYRLPDDGGIITGIRITEAHSNMQGIAHGGMVMTVADGALGVALAIERRKRGGQVTVSMSSEFLSSARIGDWLEAHARVTRLGGRLAFLECKLSVEDRTVMRAQAIFSVSDRHAIEASPIEISD